MIVIPIVSCTLLAAHFYRYGMVGLAITILLLPAVLLIRKRWPVQVVGLLLLAGSLKWTWTAWRIAQVRLAHGLPWMRMSLILGAVVLFTLAGAWVLLRQKSRERRPDSHGTAWLSTAVFLLTTAVLTFVQLRVSLNMLILNRFFPGFGWLEILVLATYGAFLVEKVRNPATQTLWRVRAWRLFSVVFFAQLILGLLGWDTFLMTGELHLPIPAVIAAGPLYRGHSFFMIILFLSTVVLVGPAWCSHLCYIGSWDDAAARMNGPAGYFRRDGIRLAITLVVMATAILLRMAGVDWLPAVVLAACFGLVGVGIMVIVSRKHGAMVHCTVYCPIGLLANVLGKINPFRIRIDQSACTECMVCARNCRYSALELDDLRLGKPGFTCTLCGDCVTDCPQDTIRYQFAGLSGSAAHSLFAVLIVTLHTVFLSVARI